MTPPTLRQRVRSAVRMYAKAHGIAAAWEATMDEAVAELGPEPSREPLAANGGGGLMGRAEAEDVLRELVGRIDRDGYSADAARVEDALETLLLPVVPPLMGAGEAADVLGMVNTNLKKLRPPLVPVAQFKSGPVYLASDVLAAKARREGRTMGREESQDG